MVRLVVTRADYFEAAMRILATKGASGVKIAPLVKSLKVTSGSFYGYFGSFDGFVSEFLEFWEEEQTARIERLSNTPEDPAERIHVMKELASTVPHEAEAAIRAWAHANPLVADAQKRVDARRLAALTAILRPAVESNLDAQRLAIMGITLLVGVQQWCSPVTKRDFDLLFDEYENIVLANLASRHRAPGA